MYFNQSAIKRISTTLRKIVVIAMTFNAWIILGDEI